MLDFTNKIQNRNTWEGTRVLLCILALLRLACSEQLRAELMLRDIAMRDRDVAPGPYPPHTSKCLGRMRSTRELLRYANLRSLILVPTAGPANLDTTGLSELPFLEGSRRRRVVFVTFRRIILELYPVAGHVLLLVVVVQVALLVRLGL